MEFTLYSGNWQEGTVSWCMSPEFMTYNRKIFGCFMYIILELDLQDTSKCCLQEMHAGICLKMVAF